VALLHDVVEDTPVTLEELAVDFPKEVIDAVALITHDKNIPYLDYVNKIKDNPIARAVKLADLHHNCDSSRLETNGYDEDTIRRYETKYRKALEILE
jgi:(p)ppGpp synthase/HD superfamily hydrolase